MDTTVELLILPLLAGWAADRLLGDPERLPHPVVGFGRWIAWGERRFNRGGGREAKGACLAVFSVAAVFASVRLTLDALAAFRPWACAAATAALVFYGLAGRTLLREVRAVFRAADLGIAHGRRQVARIVGRDTSELDDRQVRTAALETLAENLSDGVVAPLLWYLLLGAPGMLAYKMVNTLDSMIGYRTERFALFGRWAARLDDAANYLPARFTALLMLLAGGRLDKTGFVLRYGPAHASPNSGYPEAAMAALLDCRFGGPNRYFGRWVDKPYIGTNDRTPDDGDFRRAAAVGLRVESLTVLIVVLTLYFIR